MQQDNSKAIKGISIATIIVSAIIIVLVISVFAILSLILDLVEPYTYDITNGYGYYDDYLYDDYYYGYDYDIPGYAGSSEAFALQIVSMFYGAIAFWSIACSIFTLVVGIIGLRNANRPEKLGLVFGWSIAGAIVGFLGSGIFSGCILCIIMAVFANKDKQLYLAGLYPAPQLVPEAAVYVQPTSAPIATPGAPNDPGTPSDLDAPQA